MGRGDHFFDFLSQLSMQNLNTKMEKIVENVQVKDIIFQSHDVWAFLYCSFKPMFVSCILSPLNFFKIQVNHNSLLFFSS